MVHRSLIWSNYQVSDDNETLIWKHHSQRTESTLGLGQVRSILSESFFRDNKRAMSFGLQYQDETGNSKELVLEAISERVKKEWIKELASLCPSAAML